MCYLEQRKNRYNVSEVISVESSSGRNIQISRTQLYRVILMKEGRRWGGEGGGKKKIQGEFIPRLRRAQSFPGTRRFRH